MKLPLLALLALPYIAIGQSVGDIIIQKATISGATEVYVTPSPTKILGLNDSGEPSLISLGAGVTLPSGTLTISPAWSAITSTPTTLAGYGITDAQPLDATLTALSGQSTTAFGLTTLAWANAAAGRSALELGSAATLGASEIGIPGYVAMYDVSGSLLSNNQVNVVDGDYTAGYAANNVIWSDAGLGNSAVLALPTLTGQTWTLPTDSGTLALTSQITTALTNYAGSANVDTLGVVNVGTWNADSIADGYIDSAVTWNNKQDGDTQLTSLSGLSYASNAGKFVRVNGGETGFELAASGVALGDSPTWTGTHTFSAGNVTAPSITFTGATSNTGIYSSAADRIDFAINGINRVYIDFNGTIQTNGSGIQVTNGNIIGSYIFHRDDGALSRYGASDDAGLGRDGAAETIAIGRRNTAANAFRVYNTYTSSTSYERFTVDWKTTANKVRVGTEKGSGGGSARALIIQTDGTTRIEISASGEIFMTLPTSAGTSGSLWNDGGTLKISP